MCWSKHILDELNTHLEKAKFISVFIDASNHKALILIPISVRYYDSTNGTEVKLLEIQRHLLRASSSPIDLFFYFPEK